MKKLPIQFIATAALASLALGSILAAPDEKAADSEVIAAAKTLMETLKVKEQMGPALDGVKNMQKAMLDQQQLSEEEKAAAKEIMAASFEAVEKVLSWDNLEKMMVKVYADVFSKSELEDLNVLFKSPAGQNYIEKQPRLQAATMKEMQTIMVDLMPKIQESTRAAIERVKNKQAP